MLRKILAFIRDERGSDLIESAFTFPLVMLVSLAVVTAGMFATAAVNANNAANYAARRASVEQGNPAGVAASAAWTKLNASSIGDYTVNVTASGARGSLVQIRVGYSVPNFFAGLAGFFGSKMADTISGEAVSFFRAEGW